MTNKPNVGDIAKSNFLDRL